MSQKQPNAPARDDLDLHVNKEQPDQELVVVHNTLDDNGGFEPSGEGGKVLLPPIRSVLADTRMKLTELKAITMDLSGEDPGDPSAQYLAPIVEGTSKAADQVYDAFMKDKKVLSLGGNHVRAFDIIGAMRACHDMGIPFGVVWLDAHPDLNTPESTATGHVHGMASAVVHGRGPKELLELLKGAPGVDPRNFIYVGVNAIDDQKNDDGTEKDHTELKYLRELLALGVRCFTMEGKRMGDVKMKESLREAKKFGRVPDEVKDAITELSDRLQREGGKLLTEWDVDVVDEQDMPAAVMANTNGMSAEQIHDLFNHMGSRCEVHYVGVSEFAPQKDVDGKGAKLVAEGVGNLLGVSNAVYAEHMQKARQEHDSGTPVEGTPASTIQPQSDPLAPAEAEPDPLVASEARPDSPVPADRKKQSIIGKRMLNIAAYIAATIGGVLAGYEATKRPEVRSPKADAVAMSDLETQPNFKAVASRLRLMVDRHDADGIEDALHELVGIYETAKSRTLSRSAVSDLNTNSQTRFVEGFTNGTMAGSADLDTYFRKFMERTWLRNA